MGGEGSGRRLGEAGIIARMSEKVSPVGVLQESIILPNYSGVKEEALKTSPVNIAGTDGMGILAEEDPIFVASPSYNISSGDLTNIALIPSKADLVDGKVPASQLPSYVDEVQEYANTAAFPDPGLSSIIYAALDTGKLYRWGGSTYVEVSSTLTLGTTSTTAFRGDYGNTAYTHVTNTNNPHSTTLAKAATAGSTTTTALTIGGGSKVQGSNPTFFVQSSGAGNEIETIRLSERNTDWQGAYIQYRGSPNNLVIGTHNAQDSLTTSDTPVVFIARTSGVVTLDKSLYLSGTAFISDGTYSITPSNFNNLSGAYYTHAGDSSDPHGSTLTQTNISGVQISKTGDNTTSGVAYVGNIVYTEGSTPTASNYPIGTILVIYTP